MIEGRGYKPEKDSWLKKAVVAAGFFMAAESAGVRDALDKSAPTVSAEKSPAKTQVAHDDRGPLLPHLQPDRNSENTEDERERIINEEDEAEAQRLEKVDRAQHMIELIRERYKDMFFVDCDSNGFCQVSLKEGLPGATAEDLHVFDFHFDEAGTCYLKEIINGEESVVNKESGTKVIIGNREMEIEIEDGEDQDDKFLSTIGENWPLDEGDERVDDETQSQIFTEIEKSFAQGKSIEKIQDELVQAGIVGESSTAHDLLYNLFLKYLEETREDLYKYKEKLQSFFTQEDKV